MQQNSPQLLMCKTENVTRRKFKVNLAILPSHRKRGMSKKQLCMSYEKRGALIRASKTFSSRACQVNQD